ncbi:MAG: hypothetical protein KDD69_03800 [Bdellovibrionales bacterium]|nr:hypothetical protein [Bdellovibrionales bacterium]
MTCPSSAWRRVFAGACLAGMVLLQASSIFAETGTLLPSEKVGVAVPYLPESIDPLAQNDPVNRIVLSNIAYGLTRNGRDETVELEAADALREMENGKRWQLRLRSDARYANLSPVLPTDVVDSFKLLKQLAGSRPGVPATGLAELTVSLADTPAGQPQEIVFELPQADPYFLSTLANVPIVNAELMTRFGDRFGKGTNVAFLGPYQLREHRKNTSILLEAVPGFYRPGLPRARFVDFRVFDTAAAALSALRTGAVDIIAIPTPALVAEAKDDTTLQILQSPLAGPVEGGGRAWGLPRPRWSDAGSDDELLTHSIILRKTLRIDDSLLARFDLSGTFLP